MNILPATLAGVKEELSPSAVMKKSGVNVTASTEVASVTIPDLSVVSIHELTGKINTQFTDGADHQEWYIPYPADKSHIDYSKNE
ncbi:MAG: hypothetical protein IJA74_03820 [Oscillospiraceae bacterium]|nr:hypothetical protein [Oscillospiraceae bacterium]